MATDHGDVSHRYIDALVDELDISDTRYQQATDSYMSLGRWLNREGSTIAQYGPAVYVQGSFGLGTVIKPIDLHEEYDVDSVCEFKKLGKRQVTQAQLKALLHVEIEAYRRSKSMTIRTEAEDLGVEGRFGAGLPRQSDGQLLFLQHMIAKMRDDEVGSQIGIVMNGSPLFTGGAGSGESEIRRWLLENDWVEAIVALPTDIFYNTGIQTYVWLVTNRKDQRRRGKVQLIDASSKRFWTSMGRSLGSKRREIPDAARAEIVRIYADMLNGGSAFSDHAKIFDVAEFGYREIRVERPLRLAFQVTPERLNALGLSKPFLKLSQSDRDVILTCLVEHMPGERIVSRGQFERLLIAALKGAGLRVCVASANVLFSISKSQ